LEPKARSLADEGQSSKRAPTGSSIVHGCSRLRQPGGSRLLQPDRTLRLIAAAAALGLVLGCGRGENRPVGPFRPDGGGTGLETDASSSDVRAPCPGSSGPCAAPSDDSSEEISFAAMGGVPIRVRAWGAPAGELSQLRPRCQAAIEALEQTLSTFRQTSFVSLLNASAGAPVVAQPDALEIVTIALHWAEQTGGAFDPTVGPLVDLWRSAGRAQKWPAPTEVAKARARVGYGSIALDERSRSVALKVGAQLDLGAVAEGFMADRLAQLLQAAGVRRARIDVGGDLRLVDDAAPFRRFRVGIRHPLRAGLLGELVLDAGGVATSGCYERRVEIAGRSVCHVIDPRTGAPVQATLSATAVASRAADADALATALLVLGAQQAQELVAKLRGIEAVLVTQAADDRIEISVSKGLRDRLSLHAQAAQGQGAAGAMPGPTR
jgi:FAD:protein FMN transferase